MKRGRLTARVAVGALALLAALIVPLEVVVSLDHPVVAPHPSVSLLLIGSCLLLVYSGCSLRREEAARALARRQMPGG